MKQYLKFERSRINNYSLQHHFVTIFKRVELAFFIFLSLLFLTLSSISVNFKNSTSYFFVDISMPCVNAVAFPFNFTLNMLTNFKEIVNAKKENVKLRQENEKMRLLLIDAINVENENQELRGVLKYVIPKSTNYKMAKITGRVYGAFTQQLFLEARHDIKLENGSAALGNVGLIGRVVDAVDNRGRLLLPIDASSHIPIVASKSRARGVMVGNGSHLMEIEYLSHNHGIEVGEFIFTSNDGETLPPGILVGIVKEVSGNYVAVEMAQDIINVDTTTIVEY